MEKDRSKLEKLTEAVRGAWLFTGKYSIPLLAITGIQNMYVQDMSINQYYKHYDFSDDFFISLTTLFGLGLAIEAGNGLKTYIRRRKEVD